MGANDAQRVLDDSTLRAIQQNAHEVEQFRKAMHLDILATPQWMKQIQGASDLARQLTSQHVALSAQIDRLSTAGISRDLVNQVSGQNLALSSQFARLAAGLPPDAITQFGKQHLEFSSQIARLSAAVPTHSILQQTFAADRAMRQLTSVKNLQLFDKQWTTQWNVMADAISGSAVTIAARLAGETPALHTAIAGTMRSWSAVVRAGAAMSPPTPRLVRTLPISARGVLGANLSAGTLIGVDFDTDAVVATYDRDSPEARQSKDDLLRRLQELNPKLPEKLAGAWQRSSGGPDAASQAANSLVELIDWTLRHATEGVDLVDWHTQNGRPKNELHDGKPTRNLKITYLLSGSPAEVSLAVRLSAVVTTVMRELQGLKHQQGGHELVLIRKMIPVVEAVLNLVVPADD